MPKYDKYNQLDEDLKQAIVAAKKNKNIMPTDAWDSAAGENGKGHVDIAEAVLEAAGVEGVERETLEKMTTDQLFKLVNANLPKVKLPGKSWGNVAENLSSLQQKFTNLETTASQWYDTKATDYRESSASSQERLEAKLKDSRQLRSEYQVQDAVRLSVSLTEGGKDCLIPTKDQYGLTKSAVDAVDNAGDKGRIEGARKDMAALIKRKASTRKDNKTSAIVSGEEIQTILNNNFGEKNVNMSSSEGKIAASAVRAEFENLRKEQYINILLTSKKKDFVNGALWAGSYLKPAAEVVMTTMQALIAKTSYGLYKSGKGVAKAVTGNGTSIKSSLGAVRDNMTDVDGAKKRLRPWKR